MNDWPLVSVLMTSFNREEFISDSIQSVLNQTYSNFELIIVDDCSTDGTIKKVNSFNDARIKIYQNEENIGQFPNRNLAASYAQGTLLFYVDSDDLILENTLSHIVSLFLRFPTAHFLTLNRDPFYQVEGVINSTEMVRRHFFECSNLHYGPGATAITKELFHAIGGFPLNYGPAGDNFYNLQAALNTDVIICKLEFLNYRRHDGQEINNPKAYLYHGYNYFFDIIKNEKMPLTNDEKKYFILKNKQRFFINTFLYFLKSGDFRGASYATKISKLRLLDVLEVLIKFNRHVKSVREINHS